MGRDVEYLYGVMAKEGNGDGDVEGQADQVVVQRAPASVGGEPLCHVIHCVVRAPDS